MIESLRMMDGVIILFDDGKCALYSSFLLHSFISQAEEFHEEDSLE